MQDLFFEEYVLSQCTCFGEVALNHNLPRAATIRCKTNCHFAVMSKKDYQKCLLSITRKQLQSVIDFQRQLPFLVGQNSRSHILKLQFYLERKEYKRGQILV